LTSIKSNLILITMKIRFLKTVAAVVEKTRLQETWEKTFRRWDELKVAEVFIVDKNVTIKTEDGDYILMVPPDSFEKIPEEQKKVVL
jgi:hypothetical protein